MTAKTHRAKPHRHTRWRSSWMAATLAAAMTLGAVSPAAWAQQTISGPIRLPSLGESANSDLSVATERRLGEQIMREGRRDPQYLDDPVLLEYINSLWLRLVQAARLKGDIDPEIDRAFAWEAFLVKDRSVNAFAMPGGYIGMHLGLIAITNTADQLASVLAHELTHVSQRHIARSIAPQQSASLMALAGLLLAVAVVGRSNNADGANAALLGGQAAALQTQLNFSREMEREADRIGFGLMAAAGFSTAGMAAMFERLDLANRLNDNNGYPYLRSHPLTIDRISEARSRTLFAGVRAPPPTLLHSLMQARARVLMDDSTQALGRHNGGTSSPELADQAAALYAGALANSRLSNHGQALAQVQQALALALKASPREPAGERALYLLLAEVHLAAGQAAAADAALAQVQAQVQVRVQAQAQPRASTVSENASPNSFNRTPRPLLLMRSEAALLAAGGSSAALAAGGSSAAPAGSDPGRQNLRDSTEALQTWLADHPLDAAAWGLLSRSSAALGLELRALRAGAEARAALGDITGAIDRLRAAQQASRIGQGQDFIEGSVIDVRLRQLLSLRRELTLEARGMRDTSREPGEPGEPQTR